MEKVEAGTGENEVGPNHDRKRTTYSTVPCFRGKFSVMVRRGSIYSSTLISQDTASADQGIIVSPSIFAVLSIVISLLSYVLKIKKVMP